MMAQATLSSSAMVLTVMMEPMGRHQSKGWITLMATMVALSHLSLDPVRQSPPRQQAARLTDLLKHSRQVGAILRYSFKAK